MSRPSQESVFLQTWPLITGKRGAVCSLLSWRQAHPKLRYAPKAADGTDLTKTVRFLFRSIGSDSFQHCAGRAASRSWQRSPVTSFSTHPHLMQFPSDIREQEASFCCPYRSWNVDLKVRVFILSRMLYH